MTLAMTLAIPLAKTMTLRRRLILMVSSLACAYAVLAPNTLPSIGSIECAAPSYFDTLTGIEPPAEHEAGMSALREQAGLALAQLQQTKIASNLTAVLP